MRAFCEKIGKDWLADFVYMAVQALRDRSIEVVPFDGDNFQALVDKTNFEPDDIVVGSVEATKKFWEELNIPTPKAIGIPKCLDKDWVTGRSIEYVLFSELLELNKFPIFVKPANEVKLFTGSVVSSANHLNILKDYYGVKSDVLVMVSDVIPDIVSEYRCFIHNGEIVGIKHYAGKFTEFPSISTIRRFVSAYNDAPIAYTMDVFIDSTNRTYLMEINDFWAIGGYGLDGKIYVQMLIDRFLQISGLKFGKVTDSI